MTLGDTEERRRYLNARATIDKLLEWRAVPVINENDTVATTEIRYGDNDRLAARVATMMSADLLVLLSDVDGLYTRRPAARADAQAHAAWSTRITPEIEAMAGAPAPSCRAAACCTKIEAGKIATAAGTHMVIASGHADASAAGDRRRRALHLVPHAGQSGHRAQELDRGHARAARRADHRCRRGRGAAQRQEPAAGRRQARRRRVRARRRRGHPRPDGTEIGRGLVAYDAADAGKVMGLSSPEAKIVLGFEGRAEIVHRDDLVMSGGRETG